MKSAISKDFPWNDCFMMNWFRTCFVRCADCGTIMVLKDAVKLNGERKGSN